MSPVPEVPPIKGVEPNPVLEDTVLVPSRPAAVVVVALIGWFALVVEPQKWSEHMVWTRLASITNDQRVVLEERCR